MRPNTAIATAFLALTLLLAPLTFCACRCYWRRHTARTHARHRRAGDAESGVELVSVRRGQGQNNNNNSSTSAVDDRSVVARWLERVGGRTEGTVTVYTGMAETETAFVRATETETAGKTSTVRVV
ncbi:hypothetical protein NpPPO83_00000360 [Neofusicoccum parvum]|uniref:Uncharacterized protein n=1 Tax=Neofusicoccum parvum TaxID=310453 RepID=A0ACB5SBC1_9PEZI|nr:hypothetical protein NpPPO83_00000360 [Neofusicoccum parvum]